MISWVPSAGSSGGRWRSHGGPLVILWGTEDDPAVQLHGMELGTGFPRLPLTPRWSQCVPKTHPRWRTCCPKNDPIRTPKRSEYMAPSKLHDMELKTGWVLWYIVCSLCYSGDPWRSVLLVCSLCVVYVFSVCSLWASWMSHGVSCKGPFCGLMEGILWLFWEFLGIDEKLSQVDAGDF